MKLEPTSQAVLILGGLIIVAAWVHAEVIATRADERLERELAERRRQLPAFAREAPLESVANLWRMVVALVVKLVE